MKLKTILLRVLKWCLVLLALLVILVVVRGVYAFRDRTRGYTLDLNIDASVSAQALRPLRVGFGRVKINPDMSGKKPVWLAGFSQNRAATALHDDLWAIAAVIDDGHTRLGIVALDAIGFFHDDVIAVRKSCDPEWKLSYTMVCSTHNHSTPDLMGLWGPSILKTGVDPEYRRQVIAGATKALGNAVAALQPAKMALHEIPMPTDGLVADTRKPIVFDPNVRVMHFIGAADETLGTIVGWANHPETPWSKNTEITSDYCGYLRDALENGFTANGQLLARGLGGIHLFVNGAIGGLMTTSPSVTVHDPFLKQDYQTPSHDKARAVGHQVAAPILVELDNAPATFIEAAPIGVRARTIEIPLDNNGYLAASYLGLIDRGHTGWKKLRTEVAIVTIGEASIACVPGEIYPEIINGGVENAPGGDFQIAPVEVPPLRELMPGRVKFVFGLANDEIGYLIPKSEWDVQPPYLYGSPKRVYGEVNSCGPDAGRLVYEALAGLCR